MVKPNPEMAKVELTSTMNLERAIHRLSTEGASEEIAKQVRNAIEQVISSMNLFNQQVRKQVIQNAAIVPQATKTPDKATILKPSMDVLNSNLEALQSLQQTLTKSLAVVARKTTEGEPESVRKLFENEIQPLLVKAQTLLAAQNPLKGPATPESNPTTPRQGR